MVPSSSTSWRFSVLTFVESMPVGSVDALERAASQPKRVQSCELLPLGGCPFGGCVESWLAPAGAASEHEIPPNATATIAISTLRIIELPFSLVAASQDTGDRGHSFG